MIRPLGLAVGLGLALLLGGALVVAGAVGKAPGSGPVARRRPALAPSPGPVPSLARWKSNLRGRNRPGSPPVPGPESYAAAFGASSVLGNLDADNHYDPIRVFYEGRDYAQGWRDAGDRSWDPAPFDAAVAAAVHQYRDLFLAPYGGAAAGHHAYNAGLARHYAETGDPASRDAALLVSTRAPGSVDAMPLQAAVSYEGSREVAFSILMRLAAEDLGQSHRARTDEYVALALGHVDQWTAARRPPCLHVRPFMVGLTLEALIAAWDRYRDPAIPPKVKRALDWLGANAWDPAGGSAPGTGAFYYTDVDVNRLDPKGCAGHGYSTDPGDQRTPAPDLGLLIAPAFAWYYQYSGDRAYRAWADRVWAGSSGTSLIETQKVYNQSFRWSRKYLDWRDRGDAAWRPAGSLTLTAPSPSVGRANAPSAPFRVAFAGARRSVAAPVVVTPSDGGAGGAFFPPSFRLTTDRPSAIFRYRPSADAAGPLAVALTQGAKLGDPPPATYTARGSATTATGYTVTGPKAGLVGRSVTFEVALTPPGAVPPTASDGQGGLLVVDLVDGSDRGAFAPYVATDSGRAWLSADRPSMTVGYTPKSAGPRSFRSRNDGGLPDPPDLPFSAEDRRSDPSYRPRAGDHALVSAPDGPDLVPVLADLRAYQVHAKAVGTADGRARLEGLRRDGAFHLAPGGSGVEVLRLVPASTGETAVEVRFTDGPLRGRVGLVPPSYLTRPSVAPADGPGAGRGRTP